MVRLTKMVSLATDAIVRTKKGAKIMSEEMLSKAREIGRAHGEAYRDNGETEPPNLQFSFDLGDFTETDLADLVGLDIEDPEMQAVTEAYRTAARDAFNEYPGKDYPLTNDNSDYY